MITLYVILVLLLSINLSLVFFWSNRHGYIVNLGSLFNALSILYLVVGIYLVSIQPHIYLDDLKQDESYIDELILLSKLSVIAVCAFNLGYFWFAKNFKPAIYTSIKLPPNIVVILVAIIAISSNLYLVFSYGGVDLFFISRGARSIFYREHTMALFLARLIVIPYTYFCIKFICEKNLATKKYFYFCLFYIALWAIFTISRNYFLIVLLPLAYALQRAGIFSNKKAILCGFLFVIGALFFRGILYTYIINMTSKAVNARELANWIENSIVVLRDLPMSYSHFSYWVTIKGIFLPTLPKLEKLSDWFMHEHYHYIHYNKSHKYGFAGVIEGYLMGGWPLTFIHFYITGALMSYFSLSKTWLQTLLSVTSMLILYHPFRNASYVFYRTLFWYFIYPLTAIEIVSALLLKIRSSKI